jgi:hypothetical protein
MKKNSYLFLALTENEKIDKIRFYERHKQYFAYMTKYSSEDMRVVKKARAQNSFLKRPTTSYDALRCSPTYQGAFEFGGRSGAL